MGFIRLHWRGFAVLGLVLVSFAAGRFSNQKTVTQSATTASAQTTTTQKADTQEAKHDQKQEQKVTVIYRDRHINKDGTQDIKDVVHETDRMVDNTTVTLLSDTITAQQSTLQGTTSTTVTKGSDAPRLHLELLAGSPVSLTEPALIVGAGGNYRFWGPFTVGGQVQVEPLNAGGLKPVVLFSIGVTF